MPVPCLSESPRLAPEVSLVSPEFVLALPSELPFLSIE
jgi:hypothetical protein